MSTVAEAFPKVPLLFGFFEGGKTPPVRLEQLKELGFRLIIFPASKLLAALRSMSEVLAGIRTDGIPIEAEERSLKLGGFLSTIGLLEIRDLEGPFAEKGASSSC